ncbi:MAG: hypothetical protein HWN67_15175, partial [Candidatus Helarchaeota archaeon]|nr:hypothetical protein [Candidatus Helarchaeota archaeon]
MNESLDASSKGAKILKLLNNIMAGGELYSCDNFTIFAKKILIKEGDIEYNKKIAIVYDEQADMVITGELGLRFIGHKMYKAKLIIQLHKE